MKMGQKEIKPEENREQKRTQVLGYVPIQMVNLSLEEVELGKQTYVGVASPIKVDETQVPMGYDVNSVLRDDEITPSKFEDYLREKLTHLKERDRCILKPVLRQYKHLFYGLGSKELGSNSQVEHSIETGDA
jgi:hypothetical protein